MVTRNRVKYGAIAAALALWAQPATADTFRYAYQGDLKTLDPYALNETFTLATLANVYEGLVIRDADLVLKPGLAERWETLTPTHWRFHLRRDVRFHNGNPFDADDVIFSADRVRSKTSGMKSRVPADAKFVKVDAHTVDVHLERPDPTLISEWETWAIMDREWTTEIAEAANGDRKADNAAAAQSSEDRRRATLALNANGTGPFRVTKHRPGVETVFVPNQTWWGEKEHNLSRVIFNPIANDATRVSALLTGELDLIYPAPVNQLERLRSHAGTNVITGPELRTIFLGFDQVRDHLVDMPGSKDNPFRNKKVREAVFHAIDIAAIRKVVMRGQAEPAATMISPVLFPPSKAMTRRGYDPEKARKLLAEAGYPDGFTVPMDCPNNRYVNDEEICQAVVGFLAKVGITVHLNAVPKSIFFPKIVAAGGYSTSFYLLGWTPSSLEAGSVMRNLLMCRDNAGGFGIFNMGGYCNPDVDPLVRTALSEGDQEKRNALTLQVLQQADRDVAYVPLHQQMVAWAVADGVDVRMRADNGLRFKWVRKD